MSDVVGRVIPVQKKDTKELLQTIVEDTVKVYRLRSELKNCRDELCNRCRAYKYAHRGACDNCRYRHGGEWEADLHD